jgi:hypothetical protein
MGKARPADRRYDPPVAQELPMTELVRTMTHTWPNRSNITGAFAALGCAAVVLTGCARSQSSGWAQTAPVIEPTSRASADVMLGAKAELPRGASAAEQQTNAE